MALNENEFTALRAEMAEIRKSLAVLRWMLTFNLATTVAVLMLLFNLMSRLPR
jgi:hypothetical protein